MSGRRFQRSRSYLLEAMEDRCFLAGDLTANDDFAVVHPDLPATIAILVNDMDPAGAPNRDSLTVTQNPSHGVVRVDKQSGVITYKADTGYTGADSFQYSLAGAGGGSDSATVVLDVRPRVVTHSRFDSSSNLLSEDNYQTAFLLEDFDADNVMDLVTSTSQVRDFSIRPILSFRKGVGNGTFLAPMFFGDGLLSYELASGDFNGDSKRDLVVISVATGTPSLGILLGDGAGGFRSPDAQISINAQQLDSLTLADFDEDTKLDVAVLGRAENRINIFFGRGDGTLTPPKATVLPTQTIRMEGSDLNRDNRIDFVVSSLSMPGQFTVVLGMGGGNFSAPITVDSLSSQLNFTVADVVGDESPDLITIDDRKYGIQVGAGNGSFSQLQLYDLPTRFGAIVTARDVNGDAKADLLIGTGTGIRDLFVLKNQSNGTFSPGDAYRVGDGVGIRVADLNGDLLPEIVVGGGAQINAVNILVNQGAGFFPAVRRINPFTPDETATFLYSIDEVTAGDFTGDGIADIVASTMTSGFPTQYDLRFLPSLGNGAFGKAITIPIDIVPGKMFSADFDKDGKLDLGVVGGVSGSNPNSRILILKGLGNGAFNPLNIFDAVSPADVQAVDVNKDGILDLIWANDATDSATVALGKGAGLFMTPVDFPTQGFNPNSITAADFDKDGSIDLAVANLGDSLLTGNISILKGSGTGTFTFASSQLAMNSGLLPRFQGVAAADFNEDGNPDLVVDTLRLLLGRGDGTFEVADGPDRSTFTYNLVKPYVADFDGDSHVDVAWPATRGELAIFYGNGRGQLASAQLSALGLRLPIAFGDITGDGRIDFVQPDTRVLNLLIQTNEPRPEFSGGVVVGGANSVSGDGGQIVFATTSPSTANSSLGLINPLDGKITNIAQPRELRQWTEPQDRTFVKDIDGDGKLEGIQFNRLRPGESQPVDDEMFYRIFDLQTGALKKRVNYSQQGPSGVYANLLNGMIDPEDELFLGQFTQRENFEALFFNRTNQQPGVTSILVLDLLTGTITDRGVHNGLNFAGWIDSSDEFTVSDTNFDGFDDLVLVNRVANPAALRSTQIGFVGMVSLQTKDSGRNGDNIGFYRFFDWNFAKPGENSVFPGYDEMGDQATFGQVINNGAPTDVIVLINSQTDGNPDSAAFALLQPAMLVQGVRDSFQLISTVFRTQTPASAFDGDDEYIMSDVNGDNVDELVTYNRSATTLNLRTFRVRDGALLGNVLGSSLGPAAPIEIATAPSRPAARKGMTSVNEIPGASFSVRPSQDAVKLAIDTVFEASILFE